MGPDHGTVGDVGFVVDGWVLHDKAELLIEALAVDLGMDIDVSFDKREGTAHQQLPESLSTAGGEDGDTLKLGTFGGGSDTQCSHRLIVQQQEKMTAASVFAVEVDRLAHPLLLYEDRAANLLAECEVALVGRKR